MCVYVEDATKMFVGPSVTLIIPSPSGLGYNGPKGLESRSIVGHVLENVSACLCALALLGWRYSSGDLLLE